MKGIKFICFYVVLLPLIILGGSSDWLNADERREMLVDQLREEINEILRAGKTISNIFKPSKYLGKGSFSVTFEGELVENNKTVAMKFSRTLKNEIEKEYTIYAYLDAIDNSKVEDYGIPAVYYYGRWADYSMIGMTPLDIQLKEIVDNVYKYTYANAFTYLTEVDILIICREYVKISKYIHRRGVCHDDSHLGNIMFRGNKGFVVDFNVAKKVKDVNYRRDCRKEDWGTFLMVICHFIDRETFEFEDLGRGFKTVFQEFEKSLNQYNDIKRSGLKRVFLEFTKYIKGAQKLDYNRMYQFITDEILKQEDQEPFLVSWLKAAQRQQAIDEWKNNSADINPIESIPDPYTSQFDYPEPNFSYFSRS